MDKAILSMKNILKDFPGVRALDNVDFLVNKGEVHGLLGQNGAGKSTLVKILAGDVRNDHGTIEIDGKMIKIEKPKDAMNLGISIVYQELSLLPNLTVAENIFMGREDNNIGIIKEKIIKQKTKDLLNLLEIVEFGPNNLIEDLDVSQRQLVEIVKALSYKPKILILDEPTSALTIDEAARLFKIIEKFKSEGIAIIYISHKINEIVENCDRGTILKDGKVIGVVEIKETTERKIIEMMIGQRQDKFYFHKDKVKNLKKDLILETQDLCLDKKFKNVNLKLYEGEIIGITGVLGSGIYELGRILFGAQKKSSGKIKINNKLRKIESPINAIKHGLGLLSENRKEEGLFLDLNVLENVSIPSLNNYRYPIIKLLNRRKEIKEVAEITSKVNAKMYSLKQKVSTLSGGNQQKIIISRWLLKNLDIIVFIEPTVGIDVGAKREIYKLLIELSKNGKGIIIISIDFKEILELAERIFIMHQGELSKPFDRDSISENELLQRIHLKGRLNE